MVTLTQTYPESISEYSNWFAHFISTSPSCTVMIYGEVLGPILQYLLKYYAQKALVIADLDATVLTLKCWSAISGYM